MRTKTKVNLMLLSMGFSTVLAVAGSTAATLAWYANSTMSKVSYVGTSVSKSGRFSLGLVDNLHLFTPAEAESYNCEIEFGETVDGNTIVWSSSALVFTSFLSAYLEKYGYAVNVLSPVTTNSRAIDSSDNITLYKAPETGQADIHEEVIRTDVFLRFQFAFKIVNSDGTKAANQKIWLTDTTVETDLLETARESIRLFVNNDHEKFIVKPADDSNTPGYTTVAGMLDLDGSDGVYDYDKNTGREIIYGEYDKTGDFEPTYESTDKYEDEGGFDPDELENVNDLESRFTANASTFYAKHNSQCHPLTNFNDVKARYKRAYYQTATTIKPVVSAGGYTGGHPVAYTDSASRIGYSTITIYAEGWDHSLVDEIVGIPFNLGLTFETDRN